MSVDQSIESRVSFVALPVAVLAISFAAIFFREAAPTHPLIAAAVRLVITTALLSPLLIRAVVAGQLSGALVKGAVLAGFFYALHFGAWVSSLTLTSVAASVTLVTTTPLLLALIGWISGRDKPSRALLGALALAMVGLLLIGANDLGGGADKLIGDGLAALGAAAMAGYLLVGRWLGERMLLWPFTAIATGVGAVVLLVVAWGAGVPVEVPGERALFFLALAALVPQLVGHGLLTWSLRYVSPMRVGMATLGEPVGATALGWFWLGESVSPLVLAGCSVTLLAVAWSLKRANAA